MTGVRKTCICPTKFSDIYLDSRAKFKILKFASGRVVASAVTFKIRTIN